MGNDHSQTIPYDLHPHFTPEMHPIEGEVPLYRLRGESLFLFSIPNASSLFTKLAETIQREYHPNLCQYYGNLFLKQVARDQNVCLCGKSKEEQYIFWVYHNYTLADQLNYHRRGKVFPDEGDLWDLLQCLFQAVSVLTNFGLFLDLNFKNVQLSPLQKVEVYWGNVKVGNGHRSFYQNATVLGKLSKDQGLSPEELTALAKQKLTAKFDFHKCVMHSLGRLLLLYSNNVSDYSKIINFQKLQTRRDSINRLLGSIRQRYSGKFHRLVSKMMEEDPRKRLSFLELQSHLQEEPVKDLIDKLSSKKATVQDHCSPSETNSSRIMSVRVSQF